jgi:AraC-like DNA-binding protein
MDAVLDRQAYLTPEELVDVATGSRLDIDIMSARGGLTFSRHLGVPARWTVDFTDLQCHVLARGGFDPACVAVLFVERGSEATICRTPMRTGTVLIIPGGTDMSACIHPGLRYATVVVPRTTWEEVESAITGREPQAIHGPTSFMIGEAASVEARNRFSEILRQGAEHAVRDSFFSLSIVGCLEFVAGTRAAWGAPASEAGRATLARTRQAWKAYEYIEANLAEDIPISRLCRLAGASRRQLEYAFSDVFGMGPREYLMVARLNECRRQLAGARMRGQTVTEVAFSLGITHVGRFASKYRLLFGELPSDTYRRGKPT